ncbi:MAG: rhamnogalacturonan acetylesterase [Acidobacteria bacterium]|nr:rhamnogalacturonan acetylesterase [Acidobacteriota bacterium]MBK8811878.1 rhamnogalacturonan acetylesterase [Acidobacteriota bacterium]
MKTFAAFSLLIVAVIPIFGQKTPVTVYLSGDSTCAAKLPEKRPETGWGEMFGQFFKGGKVRIENRAMNGRSTKTFISEGRWQAVVDSLRKGDYVFIQFGHNDSAKEKGERYTPPEDYRRNLIRFVADVRAKRAFPVLLTPVVRRRFDAQGKFYDTHGEYPEIVRDVAKELKVPLIDMHRKSEKLIAEYGVEKSKELFLILAKGESPNYPNGLDDNTHFSPRGAEEIAKLVVEGVREAKLRLRKLLEK